MKSFFRILLATIVANVLIVVPVIAVIIGSVTGRRKQPVEVRKGSVLVQVIDGEMPESEPAGGLSFAGGDVQSHAAVMENLEKTRTDNQIKAVALESRGMAAFTRTLAQEPTCQAVPEVMAQVDGFWRREQTWVWDPNTRRPW